MNTLYFYALFAAIAFAEDPAADTKKEKVLEKISEGKYSKAQLKELGKSSNICKHLDDDHIDSIMQELDKAYLKLQSKCIVDLLKESTSGFEKLTDDIKNDDKDKKKFFRVHAKHFCPNKKAFKDLDDDQWVKPLKRFCEKYDVETMKEKFEEEKKAWEEINGKKAPIPKKGEAAHVAGVSVLALASFIALLL